MIQIFNVVGSVFGYILWALFYLFKNFGVSIFFFTILTRLLMFPTSVKQQKSMAANSRLQAKQRELKEKYGNNKQKYNEEVQKLYAKEGASPFGGCASSLLPMFIMLGIYYSVVRPLSNVIHISSEKLTELVNFINGIPGVNVSSTNIYHEMDILRIFNNPDSFALLQNQGKGISSILTNSEISQIQGLAGGFKFLGLDLLDAGTDHIGRISDSDHAYAKGYHESAAGLYEVYDAASPADHGIYFLYRTRRRWFLLDLLDRYRLCADCGHHQILFTAKSDGKSRGSACRLNGNQRSKGSLYPAVCSVAG